MDNAQAVDLLNLVLMGVYLFSVQLGFIAGILLARQLHA